MDTRIDKIWSLIWEVINNDVKLEVASYLILQAQNDRNQWNLRPRTRDGSRDVENINERGTYYCEAKYRGSDKLAMCDVGDDISNAILNKIDKLFITTNTNIRQDLFSYVEKFNQSDVTIKKLTIELIDGSRFQQFIIIENPNNLYSYLDDITVTGYHGKDAAKKALGAKATYQKIGREIINRLYRIKNDHTNLFICNPQLNRLDKVDDRINISDFFITNFAYISNKEYSYWPSNNVKIIIGAEFTCQINIKNLFANTINYCIEIRSDVGVQIFHPHNVKDDFLFIENSIASYSTANIDILCKVYDIPNTFDIIIKPVELKEYEVKYSLDRNSFDNRLLHTPFLTTYQNLLIEEFIHNTEVSQSKMSLTIFKGIGGVGKSTIINMICDRIRSKNYTCYHILHFPFADMVEIAKEILIDFINIGNLVKESDYSRVIKAMLFNDTEEECRIIIDQLFSNENKKLFDLHSTEILAKLVSNVLYEISKHKRILLIIEDIHIANKSSLDFILGIACNTNLRYTDINIILAERIELHSNKNFNIVEFYNALYATCENSIRKYQLDDFSIKDAQSLVDHYIDYDKKDRDFILNKIVEIAGRIPFNIVHFLLSIFTSTDATFQSDGLLHVHKHNLELDGYNSNTIIENRFKNAIKDSSLYGAILCYLVIFKNRLPKHILPSLFPESVFEDLKYLQEHRFIFIETFFVRFDHETLYRIFTDTIKQYLTIDEIEHYAVTACNNINEYSIETQINILYYCPSQYDKQFNDLCLQYIDNLIDIEDKKRAVEYCDFFLSKHRDKTDIDILLLCASVKETKYNVAKEYSDINEVIQCSLELEKELDSYCIGDSYKERINNIKCRLYANLGSAYQQVPNTRRSLWYLNKQKQMLKDHDPRLCVLYNRLGVSYRMRHEMDLSISFLAKSLRLAFFHHNYYLIYHNYLDISGCFMTLGNIDAAKKYMHKATNIDYTKFGNRQQVGYIDCWNMFYYQQVLFDNIHNINAIDSLMNQARDNNFTWHYCNIANLRGIIELKEFRFQQAIDLFKSLLSYCQTYTRSTKQKTCILNNLIVSLYFQNNTDETTQYIEELTNIVQQELAILEYGEIIPTRIAMVLLNLQTINQYDLNTITNLSYKLTRTEDCCKLSYSEKCFYLIYR
ncbi:MAG: hypothetical protein K2L04_03710 [Alistipes sp.]|nr:hypothetical protein [Alistipes sp.]